MVSSYRPRVFGSVVPDVKKGSGAFVFIVMRDQEEENVCCYVIVVVFGSGWPEQEMRQSKEMWMEPSKCREIFSQRNDITNKEWIERTSAIWSAVSKPQIQWPKSSKRQHYALVQETRNTTSLVVLALWSVTSSVYYTLVRTIMKKQQTVVYRGADKSVARNTSRCILSDGEIFRLMLVLLYIYIYIYI
jgi:hypothetical protein